MSHSWIYLCGSVILVMGVAAAGRLHTASHLLAISSRSNSGGDVNLSRKAHLSSANDVTADQLFHLSGSESESEGSYTPLRWVQKVGHLEDTIDFYRKSFGFEVVSHQEFPSESVEDADGGAYSRTILVSEGLEESNSFCIELLYHYGVHRYRRGNDMRGLVFRSSSYKGDLSSLEQDPSGRWHLETPDNHWIILVDDETDTSESQGESPDKNVTPVLSKNKVNALKFLSLHVSNLESSMEYYQNVLRATVTLDSDGSSAMCTWPRNKANNIIGSSEINEDEAVSLPTSWVGVELVELLPDEVLDIRGSQGTLAIEVDESIFIRNTPDKAMKGRNRVKEMQVTEIFEETIYDDDGHEFLLSMSNSEGKMAVKSSIIDWDYRKKVTESIKSDHTDHFGPAIKILNISNYKDVVSEAGLDVLINLSAPWCSICVRNHPVYKELAERISKFNGENIIFTVLDGSKIPISLVEDDDLRTMLRWTKIEGYPALFYLRHGGDPGPIEFQGEWTIKGLTSFLLENASHSLDLSQMDMTEPDED